LQAAAAGGLLGNGVVGVDAAVLRGFVQHAGFPAHQRVGVLGVDAGYHGTGGQVAAGRPAAATAYDHALELGRVTVDAHAAVELPAIIELDGVEQVGRRGVGAPLGAGAVVRPLQPAHRRIRVVEVRVRPCAVVDGRQAATQQFLAGELDAHAQVVFDAVLVAQVHAQVGLVGEDGVALVLERRQAARDLPGRRVVDVRGDEAR